MFRFIQQAGSLGIPAKIGVNNGQFLPSKQVVSVFVWYIRCLLQPIQRLLLLSPIQIGCPQIVGRELLHLKL